MEIINGKMVKLAKNEFKADQTCPICGGDIITDCGPEISISFCSKCHWEDEDCNF